MSRRLLALVSAVAMLFSTAPVPSFVTAVHHPRVGNDDPGAVVTNAGWSSSNWSGYAKTGSFTAITGSWTVQAASPTKKQTFSSQWIGIDGFNNSSLIQTGTESDYYQGSAHYAAWWEILPAAETVIPSLPVRPGDHMSASVTKGSGSSWTITITDDTTGGSFTTVQTYTGPGTSAEWIEEAPTVGGRIATLANYGLTTFDPGTANGANPGLTTADSGVMVQQRRQVSTPSDPDADTDGFNARYGSQQPAPPGS
jgi:peptidase A4-like protein